MNAVQRVDADVRAALAAHVGADEAICIALSGGMDSVVLLDAIANIRRDISAVHVHHGLSSSADAWATFCQQFCDERQIPLQVHRVSVRPEGMGIEAAARNARYQVFSEVSARWIVQGHHADDAVETLFLRLNRGTGLRGLAGIPAVRRLDAAHMLLRPLLRVPRQVLREYSQSRQLLWIEDESNADTRFDRNYLRSEVVPLVAARFPAWRDNWLRASDHAREAQALLQQLAQLDAGVAPTHLSLATLRALSGERLRNVLRYFLSVHDVELPETGHLTDIERRVRSCSSDARLGIKVGERALMHYRGELFCAPANRLSEPTSFRRPLQSSEPLSIPELQGTLLFDRAMGTGITLAHPAFAQLVVQGRAQAEMLKPSARQPTRTLKNLFQEAGIPPWERAWLPRITLDNVPVWVAGIGVAATWQAAPDEPGLRPRWEPWSS